MGKATHRPVLMLFHISTRRTFSLHPACIQACQRRSRVKRDAIERPPALCKMISGICD